MELWKQINLALQAKDKVCLFSLDVVRAFDSVWRESVLHQLTLIRCPIKVFQLVTDYFRNRSVEYSVNSQTWKFGTGRGVPQGSCSGTLFWNLVADRALDLPVPENCYIQTFADDLLVVVGGDTKEVLEHKGNLIFQTLVQWGKTRKLRFNSNKSVLLPITYDSRLKLDVPPRVLLNGQTVAVQGCLKYLGVVWDGALTLRSISVRPLLKLLRAYRNVSTEALQVIACIAPLDPKARDVFSRFVLQIQNDKVTIGGKTFFSHEFERPFDFTTIHPAEWVSIPFGTEGPCGEDIEIYTDGSDLTGILGRPLWFSITCRMSDRATVFQAEMYGLTMAVEYSLRLEPWHRECIYTDSRSTLQALLASQSRLYSISHLKTLLKETMVRN
ncbi:hypothetical protein AVEN_115337-1 [Araneus ventricosus]|uniref:Reverse transcriptase domain-containing protein n=1 Tax=Araneus ventricosus TaxID=182803 RepID=A0A4Y1ZY35_ARAVE|nr:hypothetical protein AVEN_115337-1 [Araneus ventricosus]